MTPKPPRNKKDVSSAQAPKTLSPEASLPLVPAVLLAPLWFISLALPNLVYSGVSWYDTLHLLKWAAAGVPVGVALLVCGVRLFFYGGRLDFKIDLFGALWLGLLSYSMLQALWVPISSRVSFIQELLCFSAVWIFYILSWNSFPNRTIRPLLWLANINGAVNVVFAELQIRSLNGFTSLILPTPGNYIGNTGQQNMFGLWMAICVMSSIYLYIAYAVTPSGQKRHPAVTVLNLLIMGINMWGLLNSTSRSASLSLLFALAVLSVIVVRQFGLDYIRRLGHVAALFVLVAGLAAVYNPARVVGMLGKFLDMLQNWESIGGRNGIWATSVAMFKMRPIGGFGIGQFKWHYLEAQREMLAAFPENVWQYTHWAHNEFLQWFCESGILGGVLLIIMWGLWGISLLRMLLRRERVSAEVIWACALISLISFNALWTRPFHRIENILWLSIAFALSNRDMAAALTPKAVFRMDGLTRVCGTVFLMAGLGGLFYLGDGMVGDRMMREALGSKNADVQRILLERASRHFMVEDEAMKNLGYYYMQLGELRLKDTRPEEQTRAYQELGRGFDLLLQHFRREPHSEELRVLLELSQRFQNVEILREMAGYLKPDTYRLEERPAQDSNGNVISATILVPLRESWGMKIIPPPQDASPDAASPSENNHSSEDSPPEDRLSGDRM